MKNLKYFPFERSRYFYGKLLTVQDFETEQKYMNDKRRLANRFLHGSGVVCGMNVVRVDDRTISVEMGLALDFAGREIVVDAPVIRKLDMIDGYTGSIGEAGYLYLCIEYAESASEPVHSIAGSKARNTGEVEYNKYSEGYRIFFTEQEPEHEGFTNAAYYQDTKTIYWGNGIRIKQRLNRYISGGSPATLEVLVENMGQQQTFAFDYDVALTCLQHEGSSRLHIHFDEKEHTRASRYHLEFPLTALGVRDAEGGAQVAANSFALTVDGRPIAAQAAGANQCLICAGTASGAVIDQYYRTAMEDIVRNTYQQSIYLAKIALIKAGPTYYIEQVEPMPFRQYVLGGTLAAAMNDIILRDLQQLKEQREESKKLAAQPVGADTSRNIASGSVVIEMPIGGMTGHRFFSEEISHGLGLGQVQISLGTAWSGSDEAPVVWGSPEVFDEQAGEVSCEVAARTDPAKGTFVIGIRLTATTAARRVRVHWMALRPTAEPDPQTRQRLFLKPDVCELKVRQVHYFQALFENVTDQRVLWNVVEPQGGEIDENGMYTAPNTVGVYEITAQSVACPELKASTYVVVREELEQQ